MPKFPMSQILRPAPTRLLTPKIRVDGVPGSENTNLGYAWGANWEPQGRRKMAPRSAGGVAPKLASQSMDLEENWSRRHHLTPRSRLWASSSAGGSDVRIELCEAKSRRILGGTPFDCAREGGRSDLTRRCGWWGSPTAGPKFDEPETPRRHCRKMGAQGSDFNDVRFAGANFGGPDRISTIGPGPPTSASRSKLAPEKAKVVPLRALSAHFRTCLRVIKLRAGHGTSS